MKILIAWLLAITMISCGGSGAGNKYPDQVRTNFINGCAAKLQPEYKTNCECMLEHIEKKYSLKDYMDVESDIKAGKDISVFIAFTDSVRQVCFPKK